MLIAPQNIGGHILTVTEKRRILKEFIDWSKKSKSGSSMTNMVLIVALQSDVRKPSGRKKSYIRKQPASLWPTIQAIVILTLFKKKVSYNNIRFKRVKLFNYQLLYKINQRQCSKIYLKANNQSKPTSAKSTPTKPNSAYATTTKLTPVKLI